MPRVLLLVFFFINAALYSQKALSLQECIDMGLKNNEGIRTASLGIEHSQQYRRSATEIPKTSVMYTQGQFNSIYKYDNNITVSQTMPFPAVLAANVSLAKSLIKSSEYHYEATRADLIYRIKSVYYSLLYHEALYALKKREDSIYSIFVQNVNARKDEGKATLLEKTSAEATLMEIQNHLLEQESDVSDHYIQLQTLLNVKDAVRIQKLDLASHQLEVKLDSAGIEMHPLMKFLDQQVKVNDMHVRLERAKLMPDIVVSYFNQTIYGPANIFGEDYFLTTNDRLQGFQIGLTLPLWFVPLRAKIKTVKVGTRVAEASYDFQGTVLQGQLREAVTVYLKYKKSVEFYKNNALKNSRIIVDEAIRSYNKNEITYVEYIELVQHALVTENNYLNVLHQYNMAALKIEYLLYK